MPLGEEVIKKDGEPVPLEKVIQLEQYYRVSHQAMLYRLLNEKYIDQKQFDEYRRNVTRTAAMLGFDTSLYKPSRSEKERRTYGYYIKQAQELLDNGIISDGNMISFYLKLSDRTLFTVMKRKRRSLMTDSLFSIVTASLLFMGQRSESSRSALFPKNHYSKADIQGAFKSMCFTS